MNFDELSKLILGEIILRIKKKKGLYIFAQNRSKFEGWLKVELCDILYKNEINPIPEYTYKISKKKNRKIDIAFEDKEWAIELKTINTNYNNENTYKKSRPITNNVKDLEKDIEKLKNLNEFKNKAILFVVFPLEKDKDYEKWKKQEEKIFTKLKEKNIREEIVFKDNLKKEDINGLIYFCLVD